MPAPKPAPVPAIHAIETAARMNRHPEVGILTTRRGAYVSQDVELTVWNYWDLLHDEISLEVPDPPAV